MDFQRIKAELEGYMQAMKALYPDEAPEKKDDEKKDEETKKSTKGGSSSIPHQDAKPKERWSGDFENDDETVIDIGENDEDTGLSGPVPDMNVCEAEALPRYRQAISTMPVLSIKTGLGALDAMHALEEIRDAYCPVLIGFIDDTGRKYLRKTQSKEKAVEFIRYEMQRYQEHIDDVDADREVIVDDPECARILEPTPSEQLNDDETFKGSGAAAGMIHKYEGEDHFIIYNEQTGQTARWDIYDLDEAEPIGDIYGEDGYTVTDSDRRKYAKSLHKGEMPEEKKKKDVKKEVKKKGKSVGKFLREAFSEAF